MTINNGLFTSEKDDWETPQYLFDELNEEFNFELDVCANEDNHKVIPYYSKLTDGLNNNWSKINWCNPPYGNSLKLWIEKAYNEAKLGNKTVMLIPSRPDTKYFHRYIYPFSGLFGCSNDLAWSAGIIDGEGCIRVSKREVKTINKRYSPVYSLNITIKMTCIKTLEKLKNIFKVGTIIEEKKLDGRKRIFIYRISDNNAFEILKKIYPYSITKKEEMFYAMEFILEKETQIKQKTRLTDRVINKRDEFYQKLMLIKTGKSFGLVETEIRFIKGRLKFSDSKNSAPFPSMIVIFNNL